MIEPLPLRHSWPLFEQPRRFELGMILNSAVTDVVKPTKVGDLGLHHAGCWECNLSDNSVTWSGGVYDIFGLARGTVASRAEALSLYCEESRDAMERLRSYAIEHKRGFTLDAQIIPAIGDRRWMRLIAAPICEGGKVVRLHGLKLVI